MHLIMNVLQNPPTFPTFSLLAPAQPPPLLSYRLRARARPRPRGRSRGLSQSSSFFGRDGRVLLSAFRGNISQLDLEGLAQKDKNKDKEEDEDKDKNTEELFESSHGWRIGAVDGSNMEALREISELQALAFYTPFAFFNQFFFNIFKAEVLSSLLYKIRHSLPNRYACLVAKADVSDSRDEKVVGVVDLAAMSEKDVLSKLPGQEEYLYVSGIAVCTKFRRQKVASALLQACDSKAMNWGFKFVVLYAYEDDIAARNLYSSAGYTLISKDPPWFTTWLRRRCRVLLAKQTQQIDEH